MIVSILINIHSSMQGEGDGDDERIFIFLDKLPEWVSVIPIVVCIYEGICEDSTTILLFRSRLFQAFLLFRRKEKTKFWHDEKQLRAYNRYY